VYHEEWKSPVTCLISAAVKAKTMAEAVPNIAARHAGGPNWARPTVKAAPRMTEKAAMPQLRRPGTMSPPVGTAVARKAARPAVATMEPAHSFQLRRLRNQKDRMATRKGSSRVSMGWTMVSRPTWRAKAWRRNPTIRPRQPRSHTFRRAA